MPSRRLVALALLFAAVFAVVGCGGNAEEKNAYVAEVQSAQRTFVASFDGVRSRLTPTSTLRQDRSTLTAFAADAKRFGTQLEAASPPQEVAAEHRRLVGVVRDYQRRIERAAEQLAGASQARRAEVRTELSTSVADTQAKVTAAIQQINKGLQG